MKAKQLVLQVMGCLFVVPFAFALGFSEGKARRPEGQAPPAHKELAEAAAAKPAGAGVPKVRPDEACFYSGSGYTDLIGCVRARELLTVDRVSVRSVVLGENVAVASTARCQFYGPNVAYSDTTASNCSTDRLWVEASRSLHGT